MESFRQSHLSRDKLSTGVPSPEVLESARSHLDRFRRHVYTLVSSLCDGVTISQLREASEYLSPHGYSDAVSERSLRGKCGYPVCDCSLPSPRLTLPLGEFLAQSRKEKDEGKPGMDSELIQNYCTKWCWKCSRYFGAQLQDVAPAVRMGQRAAAIASAKAIPQAEVIPPEKQVKRLNVVVSNPSNATEPTMETASADTLSFSGGAGLTEKEEGLRAAQMLIKQRSQKSLKDLQTEMVKLELSRNGPDDMSDSRSLVRGGRLSIEVGLGLSSGNGEKVDEEGDLSSSNHLDVDGYSLAVQQKGSATLRGQNSRRREPDKSIAERFDEDEVLIEASLLKAARKHKDRPSDPLLHRHVNKPVLTKPFPSLPKTVFLKMTSVGEEDDAAQEYLPTGLL